MPSTVAAFKDGTTLLRENPVLLLAGLFLAAGNQLSLLGDAVSRPLLSAAVSLVGFLVFPFVLGGFVGMVQTALRNGTPSLGTFVTAGRTHYVRLLLGSLLFALLVLGVAIGVGMGSFALGVGVIAAGSADGTIAFATMVGSAVVWLLFVLAVILFLQFYDVAIVVEESGVTDAFRRSVALVRTNLASVVGFSVLWGLLFNLVLLPEYLVESSLTATSLTASVPFGGRLPFEGGVPVVDGLSLGLLIAVGSVVSVVGLSYLYTVYTAFYVQLIAESPEPKSKR
ncbi:hypothetical protein [Haloplanus sp. C73]|uniref:DUF7847 domain-containing protein n=1 Tax=Haloplanus sp. C73 TaxID=3421641 RepID=UPI003EBA0004